jgi:hypothetical protein
MKSGCLECWSKNREFTPAATTVDGDPLCELHAKQIDNHGKEEVMPNKTKSCAKCSSEYEPTGNRQIFCVNCKPNKRAAVKPPKRQIKAKPEVDPPNTSVAMVKVTGDQLNDWFSARTIEERAVIFESWLHGQLTVASRP